MKLKSLLTNPQLLLICEKINYLNNLNAIWNKTVPAEFVSYTQVANYLDGKLTVIMPHSGWATRIRFETPSLLEKLRGHPEFKHLGSITCKLSGEFARIENSIETVIPTTRTLSDNAIDTIVETARGLKQSRLKDALLKLAGKNIF